MGLLLLLLAAGCAPSATTRVGSKDDSESVLLGECATLLIRDTGAAAVHRRELGGTPVVWGALLAGDIDLYLEFTGTLAFSTLDDPSLTDFDRLRQALEAKDVGMTAPLGYENNYAVGVRAADANRLGLTKVSDLVKYPELRLGLSNEFTRRDDGWPALARHYGLVGRPVTPLEHALAYQALAAGEIDATDVYTTDAEVAKYGITILRDDKQFFRKYAAVYVYSRAWARANPAALASVERLCGKLDAEAVRAANARTLDRAPEARTAAELARATLGVEAESGEVSRGQLVRRYTLQHLALVAASLSAAVAVAVPLGVFSARNPRWGQLVIGAAGLVQTVPSLALLVILPMTAGTVCCALDTACAALSFTFCGPLCAAYSV